MQMKWYWSIKISIEYFYKNDQRFVLSLNYIFGYVF
jgi:hypothetical protein